MQNFPVNSLLLPDRTSASCMVQAILQDISILPETQMMSGFSCFLGVDGLIASCMHKEEKLVLTIELHEYAGHDG